MNIKTLNTAINLVDAARDYLATGHPDDISLARASLRNAVHRMDAVYHILKVHAEDGKAVPVEFE